MFAALLIYELILIAVTVSVLQMKRLFLNRLRDKAMKRVGELRHDDAAALLVVVVDAKIQYVRTPLNI